MSRTSVCLNREGAQEWCELENVCSCSTRRLHQSEQKKCLGGEMYSTTCARIGRTACAMRENEASWAFTYSAKNYCFVIDKRLGRLHTRRPITRFVVSVRNVSKNLRSCWVKTTASLLLHQWDIDHTSVEIHPIWMNLARTQSGW